MAVDYTEVRNKVNRSNRSAIRIIDILALVENEKVGGQSLTKVQLGGLKAGLKTEADILKGIADEIKTLVSS